MIDFLPLKTVTLFVVTEMYSSTILTCVIHLFIMYSSIQET